MSLIRNFISVFNPKKLRKKNPLPEVADLLFEIGYLSRVKRSQVKNNPLTIADHSYRVTMITLILAAQEEKIDFEKAITMALIHDLPETRIGDLDLINKCYASFDEELALRDISIPFSFSNKWLTFFKEFREARSKEAILVHDADILDEMITDRQLQETGNTAANDWLLFSKRSIKTNYAKKVAESLISSNVNNWWYQTISKKFKYKT